MNPHAPSRIENSIKVAFLSMPLSLQQNHYLNYIFIDKKFIDLKSSILIEAKISLSTLETYRGLFINICTSLI